MAEFKPAFQIDTGKVLAALHAAADQQALTKENTFVINTGITNPVDKPDPKNLGNMNFDLTNKTGDYEVAYCQKIEYQMPIDLTKDKKYQDAFKKLEDFKLKNKDVLGGDDASLTDDSLKAKKDKALKDLEKLNETALKYINDAYISANLTPKDTNVKFEEVKGDEGKTDYDETFKKFNEFIKSVNEKRVEDKKEAEETFNKNAADGLKIYFTNFAGKEAASKIDPKQLVMRDIDTNGKTTPSKFTNIKNYKIEIASLASKVKAVEEKLQATKPNDKISRTVAFVAGYHVEVETA